MAAGGRGFQIRQPAFDETRRISLEDFQAWRAVF
jgi:hypothetical protein